MKLSISVFTRDHAEWLPRLLPQFRRIADEVVVVVNSSTRDNSEEVARAYTDRVFLVPHEVVPERQAARIVEACRGDWILGLLDDETLSTRWEDRSYVEGLLSDRYATHYWIPRRWLVPPGDRFIAGSRWYPDFQMRLFRNIPSLFEYPNALHSSLVVAGEPRYVADSWICHWDLVWRDRAARELKLAEYRLASANPLAEYYLYEEQEYETRAIEADIIAERGCLSGEARTESSDSAYHVAITPLDLSPSMRVGGEQAVTIAITNHSNRVLHPESRRLTPGLLWASYHWFTAADGAGDGTSIWENPRHELPARIAPGQTAFRIVPVCAPATAGEYLLQFDVVEEGVAWFSQSSALEKHPVRII